MALEKSFQTGLSQPLPYKGEVAGGILVTIWFVIMAVFTVMWLYIGLGRHTGKWHAFESILFGTIFLCAWYFCPVLDRWLHYSGRSVIYGYVIFGAFWELSRPLSTLFFLWGAHRIVWNEVEHRFTEKQKYNLWLGAKVLMLITFLVIIFYWLLYIAFASVWVRFASLDTIADIGTRWSQFWISMTGLFLGYSILIFATAAATLYQARFRLDGHLPWNRYCLLLAALCLLTRSTVEFAIACRTYSVTATRQDLRLVDDAAFGTLTSLFLAFMYALARTVSRPVDLGSEEAVQVEAWIRFSILRDLMNQTNEGRTSAPPFGTILNAAVMRLTDERRDTVTVTAGLHCIDRLRQDYAKLDPRIKDDLRARRNTRREQRHNSVHSNGTWDPTSTNRSNRATTPVETARQRMNRFAPQATRATVPPPALSDVSEERTRRETRRQRAGYE